ncbi:hypothetical protein QAD02_001713 [Eretmocerus hayati]|uniref:Uncharacterized protein n=1 Tax=Eretmocerus hayati TaxID=131215 RepID=A0ACC2NH59_9HYME|nr:hypothetical protein QAD02_001713 [Eretmocerus hayati]
MTNLTSVHKDCSVDGFCGCHGNRCTSDGEESDVSRSSGRDDNDESDFSEGECDESEDDEFSDYETEDFDSQDGSDEPFDSSANEPLYDGAPLIVAESIMSILAIQKILQQVEDAIETALFLFKLFDKNTKKVESLSKMQEEDANLLFS